jgi:hypothetical protein
MSWQETRRGNRLVGETQAVAVYVAVMGLTFDQINVVVPDVAGGSRFLRSLGADVDETGVDWAEWESHHVGLPAAALGFGADIDSHAFAGYWGGLPSNFAGVVLNLRTEDRAGVDESYARALTLGAESMRAPYDAFWGARYAVVRAPGPIVVGIMSPAEAGFRVAGPSVSDFT